jgi:hypothetical protein
MDAEMKARSRAESLDEIWKYTVGGGILLVALAPLALPIVILTLVAVLPLAVPLLALALVAAIVALPVMLLWKLGGSIRKLGSGRRHESAERSTRPVAGH